MRMMRMAGRTEERDARNRKTEKSDALLMSDVFNLMTWESLTPAVSLHCFSKNMKTLRSQWKVVKWCLQK